MLESGLLKEVEGLLKMSCAAEEHPAMKSIGYKRVRRLFEWQFNGDLEEQICAKTRQYAKRQITWFKKMQPHLLVETQIRSKAFPSH